MTGSTAETARPDRYRTLELQAAAEALIEGRFRNHAGAVWHNPGPVLMVLGVAGDGQASALALAIAESADTSGRAVRLIEAVPPAWAVLAAAPTVELDVEDGWRRGRRGAVTVDRVAEHVTRVSGVPVPRPWKSSGAGLTVVDVGWTPRELAADPGTWLAGAVAGCDAVLVVGRWPATAGGVESALGVVDRDDSVAAALIHPGRTAGRPSAGQGGRRLRRLEEREAVHMVPSAALEVGDLAEGRPLPRGLRGVSARLLGALSEDLWPHGAATPEAI